MDFQPLASRQAALEILVEGRVWDAQEANSKSLLTRVVADAQLADESGATLAGEVAHRDPEATQFIMYTSGTTGLPKGAMISQRAMLARLMVYVLDYGVDGNDTFLAWSPLCHMASIELGFGTLLLGGKVVVMDGLDLPTICDYLESDAISNLIFFPEAFDQTESWLDFFSNPANKVPRRLARSSTNEMCTSSTREISATPIAPTTSGGKIWAV